jgi:hypothetical protein
MEPPSRRDPEYREEAFEALRMWWEKVRATGNKRLPRQAG